MEFLKQLHSNHKLFYVILKISSKEISIPIKII